MSSDRTPADTLNAILHGDEPPCETGCTHVIADGWTALGMANVVGSRLAGYRVVPIPDDDTRALAARARALLDAATPGPWEAYYTIHGEPFVTLPGLPITHGIAAVSTGSVDGERDDYGRANAELIAAAPTLIADLLAAYLDGQPQDRPDHCPNPDDLPHDTVVEDHAGNRWLWDENTSEFIAGGEHVDGWTWVEEYGPGRVLLVGGSGDTR